MDLGALNPLNTINAIKNGDARTLTSPLGIKSLGNYTPVANAFNPNQSTDQKVAMFMDPAHLFGTHANSGILGQSRNDQLYNQFQPDMSVYGNPQMQQSTYMNMLKGPTNA